MAVSRADAIDMDVTLARDAPVAVNLAEFKLLLHLAGISTSEVPRFIEYRGGVIRAVLTDMDVIDLQLADLADLAESLLAIVLYPLRRDVACPVKGVNLGRVEQGLSIQIAIPSGGYPSVEQRVDLRSVAARAILVAADRRLRSGFLNGG